MVKFIEGGPDFTDDISAMVGHGPYSPETKNVETTLWSFLYWFFAIDGETGQYLYGQDGSRLHLDALRELTATDPDLIRNTIVFECYHKTSYHPAANRHYYKRTIERYNWDREIYPVKDEDLERKAELMLAVDPTLEQTKRLVDEDRARAVTRDEYDKRFFYYRLANVITITDQMLKTPESGLDISARADITARVRSMISPEDLGEVYPEWFELIDGLLGDEALVTSKNFPLVQVSADLAAVKQGKGLYEGYNMRPKLTQSIQEKLAALGTLPSAPQLPA